MQANGETDPDTCAYNDLALVKIDPADVGKVNPSVPGFGGPTGIGGASAALDDVYSYGNSSLRFGITFLSPKFGKVVSTEGGGWSRTVYTVTPGIPGDSGSGFLNASGQAIGTLSTVAIAPLPASNGVGDLGRELAYARANSSFTGVQLANGTEAVHAGRGRSHRRGRITNPIPFRAWRGRSQRFPATGLDLRSRPRRANCSPRSAISSWRSI